MSNRFWLLTMGSWEERFVLGVKDLLEKHDFAGVTVVYSSRFADETLANRLQVRAFLNEKGISPTEIEINFDDQVSAYISLEAQFGEIKSNIQESGGPLILDISTMPRELIWGCLTLGQDEALPIQWIYYPPLTYDDQWLTRDPDVPRMALRRSGVTRYGKPTAVVVITGFDTDRTLKVISYFEPSVVLLGIQTGEQYENLKRNAEEQKKQLRPELCNIDIFDIDAYAEDHGLEVISAKVQSLLSDYNVLLTSQGPKPSAITVYQVSKNLPEVGLFYVPAREYNEHYSVGIKLDAIVTGNGC